MDLESDSLAGLDLLSQNNNYKANRDNDEESVASRARRRKRQIELALEQSRSGEGTNMEAILVATSSLRSDEESEVKSFSEQRTRSPDEKRSFMEQISSVFRHKSSRARVRRLESVPMNQDDGSELSFMSTPQSSTNRPNSFRKEDKYLTIPKSILKVDNSEYPTVFPDPLEQNFSGSFQDQQEVSTTQEDVEDYYNLY